MSSMFGTFIKIVLGISLLLPILSGCEQQGPAERAGEVIDEAGEEATEDAQEILEEAEENVKEATN